MIEIYGSGHGAIGSALALGARGCQFESGCPDHFFIIHYHHTYSTFDLETLHKAHSAQNKKGSLVNKTIFFLSTICIFSMHSIKTVNSTSFKIDDRQYHEKAIDWINRYILDSQGNLLIYPKEAQLIANAIYFSFKRSYCTLVGQKAALQSLDAIWKGWQNIAQTRLDPSKEHPYRLVEQEKMQPLEHFWTYHDEHLKIGKTYTHAINHVVNGDFLLSINAKNSIVHIRNNARTVVAQAITDVKKYIGKLFYTNKKTPKNCKNLNFLDYLFDYMPKLAIASFIQANSANDTVSEESWNILMKIQDVGKTTWQMIEQERAGFYLAFYKAIWHIIKNAELEDDHLKIAFDQNGPLPIDNQHELLPEPLPISMYNPTENMLE